MRERERKKYAECVVSALSGFASWYGKSFSEMLYEDLSASGKWCRVVFKDGNSEVKYVLTSEIDGYINFGKSHRRLEIEEWSRVLGVWMKIQDGFPDTHYAQWVFGEGLIVVRCGSVYEGIDISDNMEVVSVMEEYDEG